MTVDVAAEGGGWDRLHETARFRPRYPSESVVRFISRNFGGIDDQPEAPATILDLGCGAGRHTVLATASGHRAFAIDYSFEGLRHTAAWLRGRGSDAGLSQSSMLALPFHDAVFDGVIAYGVVNYTDRAGFHKAIDEIRRVTRPGGHVLVVTRSVEDHRYGRGKKVESDTFILTENDTNEQGMMMHFVDEAAIADAFAKFSSLTLDSNQHTAGGRAIVNSDWIIEATR